MAPPTSGSIPRALGACPTVGRLLPALAAAALAACGGDGPTPPGETITLAYVSGNEQAGTAAGQQLPVPLAVRVTRGDAAAAGVAISFAVQAGGGQLSATSATTGADGQASVRFTLGTAPGATNTVTASLSGAAGSPVTFTAIAAQSTVALTGASADSLIEGQEVTLTGSGFSPTGSDNVVTLGGEPVPVRIATATSLTFTVPALCQPPGPITIQVAVAGGIGMLVRPHRAGSAFTLAPGQQVLLRDPGAFCLQFAASAASEAYLVGVQSTSETPSSLTPATLAGTIAADAAGTPPLSASLVRVPSLGRGLAPERDDRRARRWDAHAGAEVRLRERDRRTWRARVGFDARGSAPGGRRQSGALASVGNLTPTSTVGDTVSLNVRDVRADDACSALPITAVVRRVGAHAVWVEDVADPTGGYTAANFATLSATFDTLVWPTDDAYFGDATDHDGNGRAVIVVTKEVNRVGNGLLGFVTPTDLVPAAACVGSNEGEYFYMLAPDPEGTLSFGAYPADVALGDAPFLIAHEYTHIVQLSRRTAARAPDQDSWLLEGQATLAEEVVGHAAEGHAPGQNLGLGVALNWDDPTSIDWYSNKIGDLALYFGFAGSVGGAALPKVSGAPEQCSWLSADARDKGPCLGNRQIYGLPWTLLRWASDQFGPARPGGEKGLQRALVDGSATGYAALAAVTGVPADSLLAMWAASLYVDDRTPGIDVRLTFRTWNFFEIFEGTFTGGGPFNGARLFETTRLIPVEHGFGAFGDTVSVRAGSSRYTRLSSAGRPATAVRIRDAAGGVLPGYMRVWVVRLQ